MVYHIETQPPRKTDEEIAAMFTLKVDNISYDAK